MTKRSSAAIAALVKDARQSAYPKNRLAMAEAMIEMLQVYWIDSNDGGTPPLVVQKAADALANFQ